jgi:hypothetical protein
MSESTAISESVVQEAGDYGNVYEWRVWGRLDSNGRMQHVHEKGRDFLHRIVAIHAYIKGNSGELVDFHGHGLRVDAERIHIVGDRDEYNGKHFRMYIRFTEVAPAAAWS